MLRFLRYSLERQKPIRLMLLTPEGAIRQVKAEVERYTEQEAQLYIIRPPQRLTVKLSAILSADYIPGDDG